jgi:hypothetical protein
LPFTVNGHIIIVGGFFRVMAIIETAITRKNPPGKAPTALFISGPARPAGHPAPDGLRPF